MGVYVQHQINSQQQTAIKNLAHKSPNIRNHTLIRTSRVGGEENQHLLTIHYTPTSTRTTHSY